MELKIPKDIILYIIYQNPFSQDVNSRFNNIPKMVYESYGEDHKDILYKMKKLQKSL